MDADGTSKPGTDTSSAISPESLNEIMRVMTAIANGDLTKKLDETGGELGDFQRTLNRLVDQLSLFSTEVTRIAREVGTEGMFGGQAEVPGMTGTWNDVVRNINTMSSNLTNQIRDMNRVAASLAEGTNSRRVTVNAKGETLMLKSHLNALVDKTQDA